MIEIELKFQIPAAKRKALARAVLQQKPEHVELHAKYFDTADHFLQRHHISLRQRQENGQWRQTLKAPKNHLERIEIETELDSEDPSHAAALNDADSRIDVLPYLQQKNLRKLLKPLVKTACSLQFETQIRRQRFIQFIHSPQTHSPPEDNGAINAETINASQIEVSLDQGLILANGNSHEVYEIEFELKQGSIQDLIDTIKPWIKKYGIWLDSSSKALCGQRLQQGLNTAPVQYQTALLLNQQDNSRSALQKMTANCLEHLLPNSSAIALNQYQPEHVHQARVAIRRLRSALKTFAFEAPIISRAAIWQQQLADLFRQLGSTRNYDALTESLMPQLAAAGSPILQLPPALNETEQNISLIFQKQETAFLLLELIAFAHAVPQKSIELDKALKKRLHSMHSRICQAALQFEHLPDEDKHRLRKRVKTLRYSIEFAASHYEKKAVKAYLKALKPLQEDLGRLNDLAVAHAIFEAAAAEQPKHWFVLGWIAAEKQQITKHIMQSLKAFRQAKPFW
ncbi:CHAD domain-containing protein [Acinetobacter sp.]|uniref:CYTH and CHAD domain-containing protein n=1 Tax=Acinetobacter sp. TaxID=472 RepID=UPI0035B45685